MRWEVTLIAWDDDAGGVRVLGRSSDPDLVEAVRGRLLERLDREPRTPALRLVEHDPEDNAGG